MMDSCAIVDQLEQLFRRCATIEELPHSFDDTLLDNLFDNIDLKSPQLADFVTSKFSTMDFGTAGSVAVSIGLRLYEKYCLTIEAGDVRVAEQLARTETLLQQNVRVAEQLARTETLLQQNRPPKVLSDLFTMYTTCHRFRQQCDWKNVILWSVSHLPGEELSIFVRRKIEDFLCMTDGSVVDLFLPPVVDAFCSTDSAHVLNGTARILLQFVDRLNASHIQCIIKTVQSGGIAGDIVYRLAARAGSNMTLANDLAPMKWCNETARCQTVMKLILLSPKRTDLEDLLATVLLSPCVKLSNFVGAIDLLDDVKLKSYLVVVCRFLMDPRRAPLSDLQEMLSKLSARLSIADLAIVLDHCFPRLQESPCLVETICNVRGADCLNDPAMENIRERLASEIAKAMRHSDWEVRDTVVEIATVVPCFRSMLGPLPPLVRFDPSPYVRAAALRCLILDAHIHEKDLPQLCESVVLLDADAEPRLVAIRYLHKTVATNIEHVFRILPKAIEDTDGEVRAVMIEMCSTLLAVEEYAAETVKELQEWTEDSEIGAAVRAVLGEPPIVEPDPVGHILADMMNNLRIHFEDTIDCY